MQAATASVRRKANGTGGMSGENTRDRDPLARFDRWPVKNVQDIVPSPGETMKQSGEVIQSILMGQHWASQGVERGCSKVHGISRIIRAFLPVGALVYCAP